MYVRIVELMVAKEYTSHAKAIIPAFLDSLPKEYHETSRGDVEALLEIILGSKEPLPTISWIAVERYFGQDAGLEESLHFSASAMAFSDVLETFKSEVELH